MLLSDYTALRGSWGSLKVRLSYAQLQVSKFYLQLLYIKQTSPHQPRNPFVIVEVTDIAFLNCDTHGSGPAEDPGNVSGRLGCHHVQGGVTPRQCYIFLNYTCKGTEVQLGWGACNPRASYVQLTAMLWCPSFSQLLMPSPSHSWTSSRLMLP